MLYKSKKNTSSSPFTNTLLFDEIPVKDFRQRIIQNITYNQTEEGGKGDDFGKMLDEKKFKEFALDALDKKKFNSMINSTNTTQG